MKTKHAVAFLIMIFLIVVLSSFSWDYFVKYNLEKEKSETAYKQGQIDCQRGIIKYKMKLDTSWVETAK